ncbi:hypothetical protein [Natrialba sp. PRR66]|uniref:DUF7521 family protein n=1 Tax=Natrialba sp. PRR66 TaxID=3098146 RepID=UPI002B1D8693|nr:hypothetical protein [Natrialba sp. PRR66]
MIAFPLQFSNAPVGPEGLVFAFAAATAVAGTFVAFLAYRGYRRNASRPMLYLAVGIALLTVVPVGIDYGLSTVTTATDATVVLGVTIAHLTGVVAILYALTRA